MKEKGWLKEQLEYSKNATKDWPVWRKEALDLSTEDHVWIGYPKYRGVNHMKEFIESWR